MRKGRAVAGVCAVLVATGALSAAVARAGTYEVAVCHDPGTQAAAPLDGMSFPVLGAYGDSGVYNVSGSYCGAGGYVFATLDAAAPHAPSDIAAWEFSAPPWTTIGALQLYRAFYAGPSLPFQSPIDTIVTVAQSGAANTVAACSQAYGCASIGTGPQTEFAPANVLAYGGLSGIVGVEGMAVCGGGQTCAAGGSAVCPEIGSDPCLAANHLYAMLVTLVDATAPTASNVTGTLVAPGTLAGWTDVAFDATDTGSGLYATAVTVDGATAVSASMGSNGGRCAAIPENVPSGVLRFDWTVPCALAASGSMWLDTRTLADGPHYVTVSVDDAAGNSAVAWSGTIHTDNAPQGGVPQIFGVAQVGRTLVAGAGSWSPIPSGFSFQWLRCTAAGSSCAAIPGATASDYTVTAGDAYGQLAVVVAAANANGSTSATSAPSGVVLDANGYTVPPQGPTLANGSVPTISGRPATGATLVALPGSWSNGPFSYTYEWERCDAAGLGCAPISGASGASYALTGADVSSRVRVLVRARGPGGTSQAASEATRVIADAGGSASPAGGGPAGEGTSVAAPRHVPNGVGACRAATLHAVLEKASRIVPLGRPVTLRGSLRCGRAPIGNAVLAIGIASVSGSSRVRHVRVRTAANGRFAYTLAPGPSRRIALSYRAFSDATSPAARASARLLVNPAVSLRITPARTVNGHTITFSGAVSGGHEPRGGLTLDVEYRQGSRWMIYDTVRADPRDGRFVYRYTFHRTTQSITYSFRVAIPAGGVAGYPFQPAASAMRSVHVDP